MSAKRDKILCEVARELNVEDPKLEHSGGNSKGDGYLGELSFVVITGKNKSIELIYKGATSNKQMREKAYIRQAFSNEILFYEELYPAMQELQKEKGVKNMFTNVPKCYRCSNKEFEEFLVLENLKNSGFMMWDRKKPMNKENVTAMFKTYAKYHALCYGLKELKPNVLKDIEAKIFDMWDLYSDDETKLEAFRDVSLKIKGKVNATFDDEKLKTAFSKVCDDIDEIVKTRYDNDHCVILHGDNWCNNMLFKYKDEQQKELCDVKLIDFQMIRWYLPVADLANFLYSCAPKKIYDDLDELLQIYYSTMLNMAKELGISIDMSFDKLKQYWKEHARAALVETFFTLKVMLCDSDEASDLSKASEESGDIIGAFIVDSRHDNMYYARLIDVIIHCYEKGFI